MRVLHFKSKVLLFSPWIDAINFNDVSFIVIQLTLSINFRSFFNPYPGLEFPFPVWKLCISSQMCASTDWKCFFTAQETTIKNVVFAFYTTTTLYYRRCRAELAACCRRRARLSVGCMCPRHRWQVTWAGDLLPAPQCLLQGHSGCVRLLAY